MWKTRHHPNWHPDGNHLIMNLRPDGNNLRFCQFRYDGKDFRVLSEKLLGGGHPSVEREGKYLVTDAYPTEPFALENGEVPIRLVDLIADEQENICILPRCRCFKALPNANKWASLLNRCLAPHKKHRTYHRAYTYTLGKR